MLQRPQPLLLTVLAMLAFAGNSLLCRLALATTKTDPASFTAVRLAAGALTLWLIMLARKTPATGNWISASALFVYAAAFSWAYVKLPAATGALILFGAVQLSMLGYGVATGDRLSPWQATGVALALGGLVILLRPGLAAPSLTGAALMAMAGIAWGVYSLRGKNAGDPASETAGNFMRAVPLALLLGGLLFPYLSLDAAGAGYAVASGTITSAAGYVIWYAAVKRLNATVAASAQLSVPAITALGGIAFLGEQMSWTLAMSCMAILGGIALAAFAGKTDA